MPSPSNIICLLDDEPSVLKALGRLLASEGFQSEKFSEPARFLDHVRSHPMRLAVIDIRLPGMTGFDVLAQLRAFSANTQVIVMTAENNPNHRATAMATGARAFFLKPFDDEAFLAAVREALSTVD